MSEEYRKPEYSSIEDEGLGIDFITKALDIAREDGTKCVLLHSAATNKNMVEFYGKRGFELIDAENSRGYMRGLFANTSF